MKETLEFAHNGAALQMQMVVFGKQYLNCVALNSNTDPLLPFI